MTSVETVTLSADGMTTLIRHIFKAAGADHNEADAIATNLVGANLAGHDSHGVVRVPRYLSWVKAGTVHFERNMDVIIDNENFALVDGNNGFGQVIGQEAVEMGLQKAAKKGASIIGLRRSGHLGRIGHWAEIACKQGFVSIHFVNVSQSMLVAPFGAAERRISTAPVAIGITNPNGEDFILDFATSHVAEGKVLVAARGGKPPPNGALIDGDGNPSTDPLALYGELKAGQVPDPRNGPGALLTMGQHKGSGLALACELLAGALTGSGTTGPGRATHNGMFSIYLKPEILDDGHGFGSAVNDYVEFVRGARPANPAHPVMIPGDPERKTRASRLISGLPLSIGAWDSILEAGAELGLNRETLSNMALKAP